MTTGVGGGNGCAATLKWVAGFIGGFERTYERVISRLRVRKDILLMQYLSRILYNRHADRKGQPCPFYRQVPYKKHSPLSWPVGLSSHPPFVFAQHPSSFALHLATDSVP